MPIATGFPCCYTAQSPKLAVAASAAAYKSALLYKIHE